MPEQRPRGFISEDTSLGFWLFLLDDIWTTTLCVLKIETLLMGDRFRIYIVVLLKYVLRRVCVCACALCVCVPGGHSVSISHLFDMTKKRILMFEICWLHLHTAVLVKSIDFFVTTSPSSFLGPYLTKGRHTHT